MELDREDLEKTTAQAVCYRCALSCVVSCIMP